LNESSYRWSEENYERLFTADSQSGDYKLLEWLRNRDVIYKNGSTLAMHGGLLWKHVDAIKAEFQATGSNTTVLEHINNKAHEVFKKIWECTQSKSET